MKIQAAAIQMPCDVLDLPSNLQRADELLRVARDARSRAGGSPRALQHRLQPLPRLRALTARPADGPTLVLPARSGAALEDVDRRGVRRARGQAPLRLAGLLSRRTAGSRSTASGTWCSGSGSASIPAARHWSCPRRFGRIGLAVCADMIYRRVWEDYRGRIDLAVVSAAWPDFACRRDRPQALAAGARRTPLERDPRQGCHRPGNSGDLRQPVWRDQDHDPGTSHDDSRPVCRPEQHLRRPPRHSRPRRAGSLGPGCPHHRPFASEV